MIRLWLAIAGLGGISSVAVGALATHRRALRRAKSRSASVTGPAGL